MLKIIAQLWYKIALMALILLILPLAISRNSQRDLLAIGFTNFVGKTRIVLYDPQRHLSAKILDNIDFPGFKISVNQRIAFSSNGEGSAEVYVLDTHLTHTPPVNISQNALTRDHALAWSPDGRYLAFQSVVDSTGEALLYVWDGEKSINITPTDMDDTAERYEVAWSFDGRLAFTTGFGITSTYQPSEIYLWDGSTTINLSQNPTGEDHAPVWSADGRLAFTSQRDEQYGIYVWDGISIKNSLPDVDSFVNIASHLTGFFSFPTWTNTGALAFEGGSQQYTQIYRWDGDETTNISQNEHSYSGNPRWSNDGRWSFVTFPSSQMSFEIRDTENRPLLTRESYFAPAWSSDGQLIFCSERWELSIWDGRGILKIATGDFINAQWQSGSQAICSVS